MDEYSATSLPEKCLYPLTENLSSFLVVNEQSSTGVELRKIHQFHLLNIR